jgi:hypothetical protein
MNTSRGESEDYFPRPLKKKKCKKPLDKQHKMCYNEYVKRGTPQDLKYQNQAGSRYACGLIPTS